MKTLPDFRRLSVIVIGLTALILTCPVASAQQISAYTISTFSSNYQSIAGDGTSCTYLSGQDDATAVSGTGGAVNTLALPFAFTYDGSVLASGATVMVASNGFMVLGTNTGNAVPDGNRYGVADNVVNAVMPFSGDLVLGGGAGYYEVSGTSPNRVATYEWSKFYIFPNSGFSASGMQVKLYETSNVIEFWYGSPGYNFNGATLAATGDPCAFTAGLNGSPATTDNKNFSTSLSAIPSSNIRFTGIPPINVQLSAFPKLIDYGFGQTGQIIDNQVTVKHSGTQGTLTISSATLTGAPDYSVLPPLPPPLLPGQSASITVRFNAQVDGVRQATLTIVSNGKDSGTQTIALTAKGIAPNLAVDSTVMFKKTRTRLGDTIRQYIHITSIGQASLFFTSFVISGIDASQYFISHFPGNPILPGATDSLQVTYIPTIEGLHSAILTINNNSFNFPALAITLKGTGILPHIVLTPPILQFDSTREGDTVCKTIAIWNPGSDTLKISQDVMTSNDGDFHFTGLAPADLNIPPDQTKTVGICFIPLQQGTRQGRFLVKTNIIKTFETPRRDTASVLTVDIHGNGTPFGSFAYSISGSPFTDSSLVGVPVCRIDTLKNIGDADILVNGLTIGGTNPTAFSYSGLPPFPFLLKGRSSIAFTICGTPDLAGLRSGTAAVSGITSETSIGMNIPLQVFGFQPCISASPNALFSAPQVTLPNNGSDSTLCDTITNCGDIAAIYHATISGNLKADYSVSPSVSGTVAPHGGTTVFCVKYKPSAVGNSPASLDVAAADNSASVKIPLNGADGCAQVAAVVDNISPTAQFDTSGFFNVTITNTGSFQYTPGQPVVIGGTEFEIISVSSQGAPPNQVITIKMRFHSRVLGTFSAKLLVPGNPCPTDTLSIDLSGSIVAGGVAETSIADGFSLDQSYPNPTQGNATFTYTSPREAEVRIAIVDMTGKLIRTLITGRVSEGPHTVNFDARDLPSGTYIYSLESGSTRLVRQLILTR